MLHGAFRFRQSPEGGCSLHQRGHQDRFAGFFERERKIECAQPKPPTFFRYERRQPACLDNLVPGLAVHSSARLAQKPRPLRPAMGRAKLGGGLSQQDLMFVQQKFHGDLRTADRARASK